MGRTGDDRDGPGPRATAETGDDEQHVCVTDRVHYLVDRLLRSLPADGGIGTGAEALRTVETKPDPGWAGGTSERLEVGVAGHK